MVSIGVYLRKAKCHLALFRKKGRRTDLEEAYESISVFIQEFIKEHGELPESQEDKDALADVWALKGDIIKEYASRYGEGCK